MKGYVRKRSVVVVGICCFIVVVIGSQLIFAVESDIEKAAILARTGKTKQAVSILLPLLNQESTAVQAGYELGLIYYERKDLDQAIISFKNALTAAFPELPSGKLQQAADECPVEAIIVE